ncbi:MAG: EamA family transporter [Chloroflexi bacterium]|nr:EamA family transporter [Chloroflexota bacterium]
MRKVPTFQPGGLWLVTGTAITWGTIGIATQAIYNVDSTTSLFINLARMLVATPVLLAACWFVVGPNMFNIQRRDFRILLLSGTLLAMSQAAYFAAIRAAGVTIPTLLTICVAPLVVTCLSVFLKFEALTGRIVIALVCAMMGSVLLVGLHSPAGSHYNLLLGSILSLISAVGYASMIVCGRFLASDYHPLQVTAVTFGVGTIVLIVVNLFNGVVMVHTPQGWLLVLYLGLVPTAFAYWMFQTGLRSVSATSASIIGMLDPLVAALLAWGLFGERLAATGIIGAGLLILSIFLLSLEKPA